jgi:excisionase family DNA binding protein
MSRDLSDVRFLTVAEVADMMRVSSMTVYRLVHSGQLPAVRFGRSFRIPESAVAAAIDLPGLSGLSGVGSDRSSIAAAG